MVDVILNVMGNLDYGLRLGAYIVKDILTLRWITIAAYIVTISYFLTREQILWVPVIWSFLYIGTNGARIYSIYKENRSVSFNEEEKDLYKTLFQNFTPVEFMHLVKLAEWVDAKKGDVLIEEGNPVENIMLIYKGKAEVSVEGYTKVFLHPDQFIGEMSFLSGEAAVAKVLASEDLRFLKWSQDVLKSLTRHQPSLKHAFISLLSSDLITKLAQADKEEDPHKD